MTTITLEGKEYQLDIKQAEKLGLIKEKDNRVRSWEEFKEKYRTRYGYFYEVHERNALKTASPISIGDQLTSHESKALAAFSKILKLRRDWVGEWEHDWSIRDQSSGMIVVNHNRLAIGAACTVSHPLTFPTEQMAREFLETFRGLIEEAKILI